MFIIPATFFIIFMAKNGMGRDIWTVKPDDITLMLKHFYVTAFMYQATISMTKISIILLYLRIFPKEIAPRFHRISWIMNGRLLAYALVFMIQFILGFLDLVVFFLPIPKLAKLQVDRLRRVGMILTFLTGLFVTICSAIRLQYITRVDDFTNVTYYYNKIGLWTGLEAYLGIVCACMPAILGPIARFFTSIVGSRLSSGSKSNSESNHTFANHPRDKNAKRLGSDAIERVELAQHGQQRGVTEKPSERSLYDVWDDSDSGSGSAGASSNGETSGSSYSS
ncbi:hypothetical protein MBLNU13_g00542t2 [Cladosporium sp. NU13]